MPTTLPTAEQIARVFHETYERMAPYYGYETRVGTREFDPLTSNGKLMIATCEEVLRPFVSAFSDGANAYEGSTLERLDILVHELTGDEGEDDSFTVLRRKWLDLAAERDEARGAAVKANRAVERLHGLLREMKAAMLGYPMPMRALTPTALLHAINAELREPEEAMK